MTESYVFFDTETSGLPADWKAPVEDLDNWPRIVQLGWVTCDEGGLQTGSHEYLIRPDGFKIEAHATERHGITNERAATEGVDLRPVLDEFHRAVCEATQLVGHNVRFDENVAGAEFLRAGMSNPIRDKRRRCTMRESSDYCRLPGRYGFKWPSLTELHNLLFESGFDDAHGALADTLATMRCFFKLQELGAIE